MEASLWDGKKTSQRSHQTSVHTTSISDHHGSVLLSKRRACDLVIVPTARGVGQSAMVQPTWLGACPTISLMPKDLYSAITSGVQILFVWSQISKNAVSGVVLHI